MLEPLFLGVDMGTTSAKALIMNAKGQVFAKGQCAYPLLFPAVGWVEQDPQALVDGVKEAIVQAVRQCAEKDSIVSLAFSTQRDTMIATDAEGQPVHNAITWMDSRAGKQCEALRKALGDRVYEITGVPISTIWTLAFILWMKEEAPEEFGRAACFGLVHDYLLCALGAEKHYLDVTNACQTMLYDYRNQRWSDELMDYAGLTADRLPLLVPSGSVVGKLSVEMAKELELPEGVLLVSGGGDQQCAALGAGVTEEGRVEVSVGTAANILAPVDKTFMDPSQKLICHAHTSGAYVLEGAMLSTGSLVEWVKGLFFPGEDRKDFFAALNAEIEASPPGASGLMMTSHFEGAASPHWDETARGICLGLTLSSSRGDIMRAVLESTAMEIRKNLELLEQSGVKTDKLTLIGGAANSPVWLQIIADVTGAQVSVMKEKECGCLGAAILAGVGAGTFENAAIGGKQAAIVEKAYEPRPEYKTIYDKLYALNWHSYETMKETGLYQEILELKRLCRE